MSNYFIFKYKNILPIVYRMETLLNLYFDICTIRMKYNKYHIVFIDNYPLHVCIIQCFVDLFPQWRENYV